MKLSKLSTRLMMNYFPPLFFNRISVSSIEDNYRKMTVKVRHSILNKNLQKSIFGGTIFSAADPYHAIMYWQIFAHKGYKTEAWLKSAQIDYIKPSTSNLTLVFELSEKDVEEAEADLNREARFQKWHQVEAIDTKGEVCAVIRTLVYLRLKRETTVK
jgi:acyl-coenzyme A thioesterase PaaI-like protein